MKTSRLPLGISLIASVVGAAVGLGASPVAAGGHPPVLNCLESVCTLLVSDAKDSDGDGFTDADEQLYGSDPHDPSSCPPMAWVFDRLADGTLPGVWIEPMLDLVTISPDGQVVTTTLIDAMGALGLSLPDRAEQNGLTIAPAGIDLGTIGSTLDWPVRGQSSTSSTPAPPINNDASLYGFTYSPPSEAVVQMENGTIYVQNTFEHGEFVSNVQITDSSGGRMGEGSARAGDPWKAQAEATRKASDRATAEAAAKIADAVEAETRRLAAEQEKRAAEKAAAEKAAAEAAAKAEAARKAEEERKKAEEEKKKKGGGLTNPDADAPIAMEHLTSQQVAALVAAGSGSFFTNVGNTGVVALFTPSDYVDPTIFIVYINPDADLADPSATPDLDNEAGPRYDPNLPTPVTPQGGVQPGQPND